MPSDDPDITMFADLAKICPTFDILVRVVKLYSPTESSPCVIVLIDVRTYAGNKVVTDLSLH